MGAQSFQSARYRRAIEQAGRMAGADSLPILVEGESGTGKTRIARALHDASPRRDGPFEYVSLAALDDSLASSELFGHVAGAFTDARRNRPGSFVTAHGGTLFLDELGKASMSVQRKLLHAIEYGQIRPLGADRSVGIEVRLIAASNEPVAELVARDAFLPDLYARLETVRVRLPALRERRMDIPILIAHYLWIEAPRFGYDSRIPDVAPDLMTALVSAAWPFNLRQLHGVVRRLLLEADGEPLLQLVHVPETLTDIVPMARASKPLSAESIEAALEAESQNVTRAAERLGVDRTTLYRRRRALRGDA